ncbi:MAG: NGG1p interacting factor NIF3 [Patescibacteria group bacterium]
MKLKEIFDLAIQVGIDHDPRGREKVEHILVRRREDYGGLTGRKKEEYDLERLTNPYSDSSLDFGDPKTEVKTVLAGIDIDPGEVVLAKEYERVSGKKIDLIIGHHPIGKAYTRLHEVMDIQIDVLARAGIPENISEGLLRERVTQVARNVAPINHYQPIDAARLLNIPILNFHTPADNSAWHFLEEVIERKKPERVGEVVEAIKEIPEFKEAVKLNAGPMIFVGSEDARAGKVIVSGFTGGTSGSDEIYERMSHYGIGTEVAMHIRERAREFAMKHFVNVVIAGHMASDSLGFNIIMDELEKRGVEIVPCSGFIRHSRVKK